MPGDGPVGEHGRMLLRERAAPLRILSGGPVVRICARELRSSGGRLSGGGGEMKYEAWIETRRSTGRARPRIERLRFEAPDTETADAYAQAQRRRTETAERTAAVIKIKAVSK